MRKNVWIWQLAGMTFTAVFGSLLHFLYSWTELLVFAPISAVNESTWEHMTIFFFPTLVFACIQSKFICDEYDGFWWVKFVGTILGTLAIPILFYTWKGAFGKPPDWLNVLFFFLSAGIAYGIEYFLFRGRFSLGLSWISIVILLGIALAFCIFTFYPPSLPLFQDPLNGLYGIAVFS
jgi:hypothetical protein